MDYAEKERILRRITTGTLYCTIQYQNEDYEVIFNDPNPSLLVQSDWKYKKFLDDLIKQGDVLTIKESYELLKKDGLWSDEMQEELEQSHKNIKEYQKKVNLLQYQKIRQNAIKDLIQKTKDRIIFLENTKNQLWASTAEYMADRAKKRFLISKMSQIENQDLFQHINFLDHLVVYYFKENAVSEGQLREIARTDPWRLYWTVSKDTGTPLFPHSAVEFTELQYLLVLWTRVYEFALESPHRPTDEVLSDDELFDSWYEGEQTRLKNEEKNKPYQAFGGQEMYIPADKEGAREVYDLNSKEAKNRIKQREKIIMEKEKVAEGNLPDVVRDLKLEANRLASANVLNRSKS